MSEKEDDLVEININGRDIKVPKKLLSVAGPHMFRTSDSKCIWEMDEIHGGRVFDATLFGGQIKIPCCERHLVLHRIVMSMVKDGLDIGNIVTLSNDELEAWALNGNLCGWDEI